jgi:hypothetical protein
VTTVKSNGGKQLCCQSHPAPTTYQGVPVLQCGLHHCHLLLGGQGWQRQRHLQLAPLRHVHSIGRFRPLKQQPGLLQQQLRPGVSAQRAPLQQQLCAACQPGVYVLGPLLVEEAQHLLREVL